MLFVHTDSCIDQINLQFSSITCPLLERNDFACSACICLLYVCECACLLQGDREGARDGEKVREGEREIYSTADFSLAGSAVFLCTCVSPFLSAGCNLTIPTLGERERERERERKRERNYHQTVWGNYRTNVNYCLTTTTEKYMDSE